MFVRAAALVHKCYGPLGVAVRFKSTTTPWPWASPAPVKPEDDESPEMNSAGNRVRGTSNYEHYRSNWSENVSFDHGRQKFVSPESVEELQDLVSKSSSVAVVGSGHSFTDMSTGNSSKQDGVLVSTANFHLIDEPEYDFDNDTFTVRCGGGATIGSISRYLSDRGAALNNVASFPQPTIAGAIASGTHGTGYQIPALSGNVAAIEMVTASGDLLKLERGKDDIFDGTLVHLGCLGIVTSVTLDVFEEYWINQAVYEKIPLETFKLEGAMRSARNVGALVDFGADVVELLYVRNSVSEESALAAIPDPKEEDYGGKLIVDDVPAWESHHMMKTTSQGTWPNHMHFFMDDQKRDVPLPVISLQTEFFVPLSQADEALQAVRKVAKHWPGWTTWDGKNASTQGPAHICEIRSMAGDNAWLSPSHGIDSVSIHMTIGNYPHDAYNITRDLEQALAPFGARPHWGKLWTKCPIDLYPRADDFKGLREQLDPTRKFFGDFTARALNE